MEDQQLGKIEMLEEMQAARREAEKLRTWRMMQNRQTLERQRPILSRNFMKAE